jgi:hypothetical protein
MRTTRGAIEQTAVCLISLGSSKDPEAAATLYAKTASERGAELILCPLDTLEVINRRVLYEDADGFASPYIAEACRRVQEFCRRNGLTLYYVPYSCFDARTDFARYLACFLDLFGTNRRFRSEVRNQTYRNLQPILRRKGIEKKNRPVLDALSEFLVREIALKCFLGNESVAKFEYALAPQMELMQSIYALRYPEVGELVCQQLEFVRVNSHA